MDWEKLWNEFDEWHDEKFDPTWNAQKRKIQQLAKKYIKESEKKGRVQGYKLST